MARVKRAVNAHKKRRSTLEAASGYRGQRSRLYRKAKEQLLHSGVYSYRDRKKRKGDFRKLWITRINAAARQQGMTYNRFMQGLKLAGVEADRKVLADLAVTDASAFAALVEVARAALPAGTGQTVTPETVTPETVTPEKEAAAWPTPLGSHSARVAAARKLTRRSGRRAAGRFLVEGPNAVREAVASGTVREVFGTAAALGDADLLAAYAGPVHLVDDRTAAALSETVHPQGVVAVCDTLDVSLAAALDRRPRLAVLLAEIGDPGNAGTVLRTADAAGAGLVAFGSGSVDPYNGKAVRSAAGSHFHLDLVTDVAPGTALAAARAAGLRVLAATGDGEVDLDDELDAGRLAAPTLWVFGHEARGLPPELGPRCDARVRIPIHGRAESLNLAAAAAVLLYASARAQRPT